MKQFSPAAKAFMIVLLVACIGPGVGRDSEGECGLWRERLITTFFCLRF